VAVYTTDGSAEKFQLVRLTNPVSSFGDLSVNERSPVVNLQFPYNLNPFLVETRLNGGAATVDSNRLKLTTGAATNQSAQVLSLNAIKYEPGEGGKAMFTAAFTPGVAGNIQYIGPGDTSDGYFFGYEGTAFGVKRTQGGSQEMQTLTVATGSADAEDITITLDGDATATVTVTASSNVTTTANEIAAHDYSGVGTGWFTKAAGDVVEFVSFDAAPHSGTFTLSSATSAVGTFAQDVGGVVATEEIVPQTSWNLDKADGTGALPALSALIFLEDGNSLDFEDGEEMVVELTHGSVYQVQYQWLGYGAITFSTEHPETGALIAVHRIQYADSSEIPSIDNPTLPLCVVVKNTTSAVQSTIFSSSLAGFVEGKTFNRGPARAVDVAETAVGTTEIPLITLHNRLVYNSVINRVRARISFVRVTNDGTKPGSVKLYLNPTITDAAFVDIDTSNSVLSVDTTASAVDTATGIKQFTLALAKVDSELLRFGDDEFILNPGDFLTATGLATGVGGGAMSVSMNAVELF